MRIWAVVYNPAYSAVVSDGPIFLESVSVTRALDRLTRLSAPVAGNDLRALQYITSRRVLEIYTQPTTPAHLPAAAARLLGAFIIDNLDVAVSGDEIRRTIKGTGVMLALKDTLTLPGLTYDDATLEYIFNDNTNGLAQIASWTADVEAGISTDKTSVRFDGTSVFKSMQTVCEIQGLHLRHTSGTEVEIGAFGTGNGYRLEYLEGDTGIDNFDTMPLLIESMSIIEDAAGDFYNYVLGYGAGQGDARLTLEKSTRMGITTVNDGSRNHYIIKDATSIAAYGQIERMVQIKSLAPVGTSEAQQVNAANALYDGLKADLDRHKDPQESYKVTVRNVPATLQPGDKLRVLYQGAVFKDGLSAPYQWKDINADFWIMSVSETVTAEGVQVQLEISNVDRYQQNAAEIIVGMVDRIEVQGIGVQPYPIQYPWGPFQQPIDTVTDISFQFPIFDNVLRLIQVRAFLFRAPWTAVAGTAQAGGDHRHRVAQLLDSDVYETNGMLDAQYRFKNAAEANLDFWMHASTAADWYTEGASGTHTHDTAFDEVQQDTVVPEDVTLKINGTTVSSTLFPNPTGSDIEEVDITDEVLAKSGGWRGTWHDVLIQCATNRGDISFIVFIDVEVGTVRT